MRWIRNRHTLCLAALLLLGLAPIVLMAHHIQSNWVPLPYWDEWATPGNELQAWLQGKLTFSELISQHNESRKFFPKLLYFALALAGGWDVRKEITVLFLEVCLMSFVLWHLLRQTQGSTPKGTLIAWAIMMFLCFSPVQYENFLWGIQLEPVFIGIAVLIGAAVNLSTLPFSRKTLINLALALVSTYTYANGMLLWLLAFPLAASSDTTSRRNRILWRSVYVVTAIAAIGCYFIGYERPHYHPEIASLRHQGIDIAHYAILWTGAYLVSDKVNLFSAGLIVAGLFTGVQVAMSLALLLHKQWRPFYPWLLLGAYSVATVLVTAFGRVLIGVAQSTDGRYRVFSVSLYLALVGGAFALYCVFLQRRSRKRRLFFLIPAALLLVLMGLCWIWSYQEKFPLLRLQRQNRVDMLTALEWSTVIPDNPDLKLIFPFPDVLRNRAIYFADCRLLRIPIVRGPLAEQVRQEPSNSNGAAGEIERCVFDDKGLLSITGWAWLPDRNRRADLVVIGCKDSAGAFKPVSVFRTGGHRDDLFRRFQIPRIDQAGFSRLINPKNLPPGEITIEGWGIDVSAQKALPLAGSSFLSDRKDLQQANK